MHLPCESSPVHLLDLGYRWVESNVSRQPSIAGIVKRHYQKSIASPLVNAVTRKICSDIKYQSVRMQPLDYLIQPEIFVTFIRFILNGIASLLYQIKTDWPSIHSKGYTT